MSGHSLLELNPALSHTNAHGESHAHADALTDSDSLAVTPPAAFTVPTDTSLHVHAAPHPLVDHDMLVNTVFLPQHSHAIAV